jgi:hypothetical protein
MTPDRASLAIYVASKCIKPTNQTIAFGATGLTFLRAAANSHK